MSMETDLQALLVARCARTFATVAPIDTVQPFLVWQEIGGKTLRFLDNTAADKRNSLIQVTAWAVKSGDARALIRGIEDDLCASSAFVAEPQGEALATYDDETKSYGAIQRFSITATRT